MGRKAAHNLTQFPASFFAWSAAFGDDLGYEPKDDAMAVKYPPGSPEKVATLAERLQRGQRLWNPDDAVEDTLERTFDRDGYRIVGDGEFGAVVGTDCDGGRHRYSIWTKVKPRRRSRPQGKLKFLYVTATAGVVDSFTRDEELQRIYSHAQSHGACEVTVASLFSRRVVSAEAMREVNYPVTNVGLLWIRWAARYVDRVIACWGDSPKLGRHLDVLWLLSRTSAFRHIYVAGLDGWWPSPITSRQGLERWTDYHLLIADKDEEEIDGSEVSSEGWASPASDRFDV